MNRGKSNDLYKRYVMFSLEHYMSIPESFNKRVRCNNGVSKRFTMITTDTEAYCNEYPDAIIICTSDIRLIKTITEEEFRNENRTVS